MGQKFFVFGMFRSGTTLFARMLDAHEDIACAADAYRPFYNAFRDAVARDLDVDVDPYDPLGDYFADDDSLRLYDAIQAGSLDRSVTSDRSVLLDRLRGHSEPMSPYISESLLKSHVAGDIYGEILDALLEEVPAQYGTGDERWYGTKDAGVTEFVPALPHRYPDSKFVLVIRDPRGVCASKYAQPGKYPWLFLTRQWRKLALLSHAYNTGKLAEVVHLVRYEDLVIDPEPTIRDICVFLDVPVDEDMLDPGTYTDGRGDQWIQNTSFDDGKTSFNTDSVRRWETTLDPSVVAFIERLCFAEMGLSGYEREHVDEPGYPDEQLTDPPTIPLEELAEWITPYYKDETTVTRGTELGTEEVRHRLLMLSDSALADVDDRLVRSHFLETELLEACRDAVGG